MPNPPADPLTPLNAPENSPTTPSAFRESGVRVVALWFALLIVAALAKVGIVALVALFLTGALPFILIVLWLSLSAAGKRLRAWLDVWHRRTFFLALLFCYGTDGHKWASDVIKEIIHLDGRKF
jgi:hypothetical protein